MDVLADISTDLQGDSVSPESSCRSEFCLWSWFRSVGGSVTHDQHLSQEIKREWPKWSCHTVANQGLPLAFLWSHRDMSATTLTFSLC